MEANDQAGAEPNMAAVRDAVGGNLIRIDRGPVTQHHGLEAARGSRGQNARHLHDGSSEK